MSTVPSTDAWRAASAADRIGWRLRAINAVRDPRWRILALSSLIPQARSAGLLGATEAAERLDTLFAPLIRWNGRHRPLAALLASLAGAEAPDPVAMRAAASLLWPTSAEQFSAPVSIVLLASGRTDEARAHAAGLCRDARGAAHLARLLCTRGWLPAPDGPELVAAPAQVLRFRLSRPWLAAVARAFARSPDGFDTEAIVARAADLPGGASRMWRAVLGVASDPQRTLAALRRLGGARVRDAGLLAVVEWAWATGEPEVARAAAEALQRPNTRASAIAAALVRPGPDPDSPWDVARVAALLAGGGPPGDALGRVLASEAAWRDLVRLSPELSADPERAQEVLLAEATAREADAVRARIASTIGEVDLPEPARPRALDLPSADRALRTGDDELAADALIRLVRTGDRRAVRELIRLVRSPRLAWPRREVLEALAWLDEPAARSVAAEALALEIERGRDDEIWQLAVALRWTDPDERDAWSRLRQSALSRFGSAAGQRFLACVARRGRAGLPGRPLLTAARDAPGPDQPALDASLARLQRSLARTPYDVLRSLDPALLVELAGPEQGLAPWRPDRWVRALGQLAAKQPRGPWRVPHALGARLPDGAAETLEAGRLPEGVPLVQSLPGEGLELRLLHKGSDLRTWLRFADCVPQWYRFAARTVDLLPTVASMWRDPLGFCFRVERFGEPCGFLAGRLSAAGPTATAARLEWVVIPEGRELLDVALAGIERGWCEPLGLGTLLVAWRSCWRLLPARYGSYGDDRAVSIRLSSGTPPRSRS